MGRMNSLRRACTHLTKRASSIGSSHVVSERPPEVSTNSSSPFTRHHKPSPVSQAVTADVTALMGIFLMAL